MDSLRWILLIVAIAIIAVIYLTGRKRKTSVAQYWDDQPADGVAIEGLRSKSGSVDEQHAISGNDTQARLDESELQEMGRIIVADRTDKNRARQVLAGESLSAGELDKDLSIDEGHFSSKPEVRSVLPRAGAEERLIMLSVMAPDGHQYSIQEIRTALDAEGLEFGLHDIYHRLDPVDSHNVIYSISSLVEPGTLAADNAESSFTPGLALFMQLPGDFDPVLAYDDIIDTATRIKNTLGADLCDERRQRLSIQTMRYMRDQIIEYTHKNYIQAG